MSDGNVGDMDRDSEREYRIKQEEERRRAEEQRERDEREAKDRQIREDLDRQREQPSGGSSGGDSEPEPVPTEVNSSWTHQDKIKITLRPKEVILGQWYVSRTIAFGFWAFEYFWYVTDQRIAMIKASLFGDGKEEITINYADIAVAREKSNISLFNRLPAFLFEMKDGSKQKWLMTHTRSERFKGSLKASGANMVAWSRTKGSGLGNPGHEKTVDDVYNLHYRRTALLKIVNKQMSGKK